MIKRFIAATTFIILSSMSHALANETLNGEALVKSECSSCHGIGPTGASPNPKSPPFREIVKRYPPENLIEALAEGISIGHSEMPEFIFEPDEIMAIVDYLNTLKP